MVLTALNFSCPRCRDLTGNLMKSVDAFEVLLNRNAGMPAEILISTIRNIVMSAVSTNEIETAVKVDNENEILNNQNPENAVDIDLKSAMASTTTDDLSAAINLDLDIGNPENEQENMHSTQFESKSNPSRVKKTGKRKKRGRPKKSQNAIPPLQSNKIRVNSRDKSQPWRSRRRNRTTSSLKNASLVPEQNSADPQPRSNFRPSYHGSRPIVTKRDLDQAKEYMKTVTMETPDGLYFNLFECIKCSKQFTQAITAKRHIACIHFNKSLGYNSKKTTVQLVPDETGNMSRSVKVKVFDYRHQRKTGGKNSGNSGNRSCIINLSGARPETLTAIKKSGKSREKKRNSKKHSLRSPTRRPSSSLSASLCLTNRSISFPVPIPPDLTVRNPCANFDLERTLNVRVCVELTPNLANIRIVSSDHGQCKTTMTTARTNVHADVTFDFGHTANEFVEADSNTHEGNYSQVLKLNPSPMKNQIGANSGENLTTSETDGTVNTGQMLSDVLSDLTEMDVDTIMKMEL